MYDYRLHAFQQPCLHENIKRFAGGYPFFRHLHSHQKYRMGHVPIQIDLLFSMSPITLEVLTLFIILNF